MRQIIVDFGLLRFFGREVPLRIYGYGLMLVLGFLVSIWVAQWRARRMGESADVIARCGILSLIFGIAGARAAFVIEKWHSQFADASLGEVLNVTSGGLIYYGGLALATLAVVGYLFLKRLPVRRYVDIVAPSLMIGLAFGRAGCLLNGCCFGGPCDEHWPLGMRFPMFSKPLVKLDGRANPFSHAMEAPSPVYAHQYARCLIDPDERLVDRFSVGNASGEHAGKAPIRPPRHLHGRLEADQLATMFGPESEARESFAALAGSDGRVNCEEWQRGLARQEGFLRGSEGWDEASHFDLNRDGKLAFDEAWDYLRSRRGAIVARFDADSDEVLADRERQDAQGYLQADLLALAGQERSLPVKPAQALAMANALVMAGLLAAFHRLRRREGQVFALMLVLYPVTRFVEELIRQDNPHDLLAGALTHNQYTSLAMLGIGMLMWLLLCRLPASAGPIWAHRQAAARPIPPGRAGRPDRKARNVF